MTNSQDKGNLEGIYAGLFGSETRAEILKNLIEDSKTALSLTELSKKTGLDVAGIHREVSKLHEFRLIVRSIDPNKYQINKEHPFYKGLLEIFKKSPLFSNCYFIFEEAPVMFPYIASDYLNIENVSKHLKEKGLKSQISKSLIVYEGHGGTLYLPKKEFEDLSKEIVSKIIENPQFGIEDNNEVIKKSNNLIKIADEIEKMDYATSSNKQLAEFMNKYYESYEKTHISGWVHNSSDMPQMLFTNHLLDLLRKKIDFKKSLLKVNEIFSKLTTPIEGSFAQKEYESLLNLFKIIKSDIKFEKIFEDYEPRNILIKIAKTELSEKLKNHIKEFGWLGYCYLGPNWDEKYFVNILSSFVKQKEDPNKLLKKEIVKKEELIKEQERIMNNLEFDDKTKKIFEVAKGFVLAKAYRKDAMYKFLSKMELLFKQIERNLHIPINDTRYCYPHEFELLLSGDQELILKLRERQKFSLCESTGKYEEDLMLEGQEAKNHLSKLVFDKQENKSTSILNGSCACPGRVKGIVKIVNLTKEIDKVNKGDILVSVMTTPDLVPAMKKAAAIVTDMGGLTCHAAIVSRELNIPCVVGTRIATKILKDGMFVEVDATHSNVKIID